MRFQKAVLYSLETRNPDMFGIQVAVFTERVAKLSEPFWIPGSMLIPKISLKTYITDSSTFYAQAQNYYSNFDLNSGTVMIILGRTK